MQILLLMTGVSLNILYSNAQPQLWLNHNGFWYIYVGPQPPAGLTPPSAAQMQQKAPPLMVAYNAAPPPMTQAGGAGNGHKRWPTAAPSQIHIRLPGGNRAPPPPPANPPLHGFAGYPPPIQPAIRIQQGRGPPSLPRYPPQPPPPPPPPRHISHLGYPSPSVRHPAVPGVHPPPVQPSPVMPPPPRAPVGVDVWGRPLPPWNHHPQPATAMVHPGARNTANHGYAPAVASVYAPQHPRPPPNSFHPGPSHAGVYHGVAPGIIRSPYPLEGPDVDLRIIPCGASALVVTTAAPPGGTPAEPRCRCEDAQDCDVPGKVQDPVCPLWTTCCCMPLPATQPSASTAAAPATG